jgi:putative ABC transport system substrate-binding protein
VTLVRLALAVMLALSVLALPVTVGAQGARKVPRIGVLTWEGCPSAESAFGKALADLGYTWGQTVQVECRSAEGDYGRLSASADALAARRVDVIAALTHITAYAAHRATKSIPIVMIASGDPVRTGLVGSLARPGGNVTGLTYYAAELVEKRLQLLKEMVPRASRIAILGNPESDHVFGLYRNDADGAARTLGISLVKRDTSQPRGLEEAFEIVVKNGAQGLLVLTDPMLSAQAPRIAELATQHRLPAMHWGRWFVEAGGLAAYSADYDAMIRRTAYYVDRILKGAKPADLPVEQPTKFELAVNLRTAKAIGLTLPPAILERADQILR